MAKILVIEDEELIRDSLLELLQLEGFSTLDAETGDLGVQLAQKHKPDLILCDVMMPNLDGYGVLNILRQNIETATIPFIFLTARAAQNDMRQGMNLGADDYITKPYERSKLLDAITTRLQKSANIVTRYRAVCKQVDGLEKSIKELQQFNDTQRELIQEFSRELKNPFSDINVAIHMLRKASQETDRDRYLNILQEECNRGTALLSQLAELQNFLTPENAKFLRQLNLLKDQKS